MLMHKLVFAAVFSTPAAADSCFFKMYPSGSDDIFVDCGGELAKAYRRGSMWTGVMTGPGSRLIQIYPRDPEYPLARPLNCVIESRDIVCR
ncbi:MAG: hypothetical protein QOF41_1129 [Methylobacteriaceae bacterium]|nr:hypothetical protein [Methylobacteriaceae bacterium]